MISKSEQIIKVVLFLVCVVLLTDCAQKRQKLTQMDKGVISYEFEYIIVDGDTLFDGYCKNFYSNGKVEDSIVYNKGKMHGQAHYYWDNGQLRSMANYSNDKLTDQYKNWDYKGNAIDSNTVINGHGIYTMYYKNGSLLYTAEMKDSIENGRVTDYAENGKVKSFFTLVNGIKEGEAMVVKDGNTTIFTYTNNRMNGYRYVYDSLNTLLLKDKVRDNILIDTAYVYSNRKLVLISLFKSTDFTEYDSIRLGHFIETSGFPRHKHLLSANGILLKKIYFDEKGKRTGVYEVDE